MRALVQRVTHASVTVAGDVVGEADGAANESGQALLVLLGVTHDDGPAEVTWTARKVAGLRILAGERSVSDVSAPLLVVSQFTLYADSSKGRRPSWNAAAPAAVAEPVVEALVAALRAEGLTVATGVFGADMRVALVNDGPVTLLLDTATAGQGAGRTTP